MITLPAALPSTPRPVTTFGVIAVLALALVALAVLSRPASAPAPGSPQLAGPPTTPPEAAPAAPVVSAIPVPVVVPSPRARSVRLKPVVRASKAAGRHAAAARRLRDEPAVDDLGEDAAAAGMTSRVRHPASGADR